MSQSATTVLYVDQTAKLAGGELNLYDFLRSDPASASVVLFEDGPLRSLLEDLDIPVSILPPGPVDGIRRTAGLSSIARAVPAAFRLRNRLLAKARGADIVYANSQKAFLVCAVSRRRGQPLIWHLHDMLIPEHFGSLLRKLAVFAGNHFASRIIVNSNATAAAFAAAGGRADKVRVVYCGLDPAPFDHVKAIDTAELRSTICPKEAFLVGVFGRLAEWKGQHILLEAVRSLPGIHVAVVGDAFFGEDSYKARLLKMADEPDLAGRVHFLGFQKDIPGLMKAVDLIAHTSTAPEPFGRVIVEGMLARKPVVASNAGGAAEIIEQGWSGILCKPGSISELREIIRALSVDPRRCDRLAAEGRKRAEDFFSLDQMVVGIRRVMDEVAK